VKHPPGPIKSRLSARIPVHDPELLYIPHYVYELVIAGFKPSGTDRNYISVNSINGAPESCSDMESEHGSDERPDENPEEGIPKAIIQHDGKSAFGIAANEARERFLRIFRSLPDDAQRTVQFDVLESCGPDAMIRAELIQLVSKGMLHRPAWCFQSERGRILVDAVNLKILKGISVQDMQKSIEPVLGKVVPE